MDQLLKEIKEEIYTHKYKLPEHLLKGASDFCLNMVSGNDGYYHQLIALLIRKLQPKTILDLGTATGTSALMIYSEMQPDAKLISVDIEHRQEDVPQPMFKDPRVEFVLGDDCNLNIYRQIPQNINFMFMDTDHWYQQLRDEFDVYEPLLADDAIILIDDINFNDEMKFFKELPYEKWDLTDWCHVTGFGMFRYKKTKNFENPLAEAALRSSRIGFRKYAKTKSELDNTFYRKSYARAEKSKLSKAIKTVLRPIKKKLIITNEPF